MGIKSKIYCGHDFEDETKRLNQVIDTCKSANITPPQEVYDKLHDISNGKDQIKLNFKQEEKGDGVIRYRVRVEDIVNSKSDFLYVEFSKFKDTDNNEEEMELADILLDVPDSNILGKFEDLH